MTDALRKEAQRRLRHALMLKEEIDERVAKLQEHKEWFAQNFPEGFVYKGLGQAIVRWVPEFTVDVERLLRVLKAEQLKIALRLAGVRHSVVVKLKEQGVLSAEVADSLVTKVKEHPAVEFRRG